MPPTTRRQQTLLDAIPSSPPTMADSANTPPSTADAIEVLKAQFAAELEAMRVQLSTIASLTPVSSAALSIPKLDVLPTSLRSRPWFKLATPSFSGNDALAETFINDLAVHYEINAEFYDSPQSFARVQEARLSMSGDAAKWYDELKKSRPGAIATWDMFMEEFRLVYLSSKKLDNPYNSLRSLRMTGTIQEFIALFNTQLGRCDRLPVQSVVADFRNGLPAALNARLDESRTIRFGGLVEWPTLADMQSSAASLTRPASSRTAAAVAAAAIPLPAPAPPPPATTAAAFQPKSDTRLAELDERERKGLCRYCSSASHKVVDCPLIKDKEAKRRREEGKA